MGSWTDAENPHSLPRQGQRQGYAVTASNRSELIDMITQDIFDQLAGVFPRRISINYDDMAQTCGVMVKTLASKNAAYANSPTEFDPTFGENFRDIVRNMLMFLVHEDYIVTNSPSSDYANPYGLTERGARLRNCLPSLLRSQG